MSRLAQNFVLLKLEAQIRNLYKRGPGGSKP